MLLARHSVSWQIALTGNRVLFGVTILWIQANTCTAGFLEVEMMSENWPDQTLYWSTQFSCSTTFNCGWHGCTVNIIIYARKTRWEQKAVEATGKSLRKALFSISLVIFIHVREKFQTFRRSELSCPIKFHNTYFADNSQAQCAWYHVLLKWWYSSC